MQIYNHYSLCVTANVEGVFNVIYLKQSFQLELIVELYEESLGKESGLYTDRHQQIRPGDEIHRAIRLIIDVGMHLKGMTRVKAIK